MSNVKHEHERTLPIIINSTSYEWHDQYITGAEIRKLGAIPEEDEVFLKIKEPWEDEKIDNETRTDLARPGIEHFYSHPKVIHLIVNGREKLWDKKEISFEEIIVLAFGPNALKPTTVFTVTYKNGPKENPQGTMSKGDKVRIKNKMIFNVTATDKS